MTRGFFFKSLRILNINYLLQRNEANRLHVLLFHRINDYNHKFYPAMPVKVFDRVCDFFSRRFNIITFSEIGDYFKKTRRPAAIISFDDGFYDVLENAYPILAKYRLRFNINVVTESMETGLPQDNIRVYDVLNATDNKEYINTEISSKPLRIFIDRDSPSKTELEFVRLFQGLGKEQRRLVADDIVNKLAVAPVKFSRMLSADDIKYLHKKGAEIGSHTHSHAILSNLDMSEVEFELAHSKKALEGLCGRTIDIIAYPDGKYNEAIIRASQESGYKYMLLCENSVNVIKNADENRFSRVNLHHNTLDENLAKIFGFHKIIYSIKAFLWYRKV